MDQKLAKKISQKVQLDYNRIAEEFSNKRRGLTPDISEFSKYIKKGDNVLDFGCGNGRACELIIQPETRYTGTDNSVGLIKQAKSLYPDKRFVFCENLDMFHDGEFDVALALAVLHHIPSEQMRLNTMNNLYRILKPGGKLILTVWDLRREKDKHNTIEGGDLGDILYSFKNSAGNLLAERYIHVFSEEELRELINTSGFKIIDFYQNRRGKRKINHNLVVIAQK